MEYAKENWTNRVFRKMKKHKLISIIVVSLVMFSIFNGIMVYQFIKILQNI